MRLSFAVYVPNLTGAELVGARIALTPHGRGAAVEYRVGDRAVSYFMLPPQQEPLPPAGTFRHVHAAGYRAVVWRDMGLLHAMVGALPAGVLERPARDCVKQASTAPSVALRPLATDRPAAAHTDGPTYSSTPWSVT